MIDPPIISDRTDLTLDEAKAEYIELGMVLHTKTFPGGATGWSFSVVQQIESRLNYLRATITDRVCDAT